MRYPSLIHFVVYLTALFLLVLTVAGIHTCRRAMARPTHNPAKNRKRLLLKYACATALNLITRYRKACTLGRVLGEAAVFNYGILVADRTLLTNGILVGDGIPATAF